MVNRIFQEMDSSPSIVGSALAEAFNNKDERKLEYNKYFTELRNTYVYKFNLLKALVKGINTIDNKYLAKEIEQEVRKTLNDDATSKALKGLPYVDFPENLEPESGFFAILDFTKVKGMKYKGNIINTEKDLLRFFYKNSRIRFLVGQSISWPNEDELVGRVTFAIDNEKIITALSKMNNSLLKLAPGNEYIIRKNELKDQAQMAKIKIDGWRTAYDKIVASKYLKSLSYEEQTKRYISSFEEYKDLVLVADKDDEILGYACFSIKNIEDKYDSELVSLYVKPSETGKGIGTELFKETAKELLDRDKRNMIVWCLVENTHSIEFYKELGGKEVETKQAVIGDESYLEYGFYFDLKEVTNDYF